MIAPWIKCSCVSFISCAYFCVSSILRCMRANGLLAHKNGPTGYLGDLTECNFSELLFIYLFWRWRCLCGVSSLLLQRFFSLDFFFLYSRTPIRICCIFLFSFSFFLSRAKGVFLSQGGSKVIQQQQWQQQQQTVAVLRKTGMFSDRIECSYPSTFGVKTGADGF